MTVKNELVILSGKGGTGKTSITAALAALCTEDGHKAVFVDADVDAANLAMLLHPQRSQKQDFSAGEIAQIDPDLCTACGLCADTCHFDAVQSGNHYEIDTIACEGCAACYYVCPSQAITMHAETSGVWFQSVCELGPLYHAELFPGGENSGKLVSLLKQEAQKEGSALMIVDGPPGTACSAIAACSGANLALLVTEPSLHAFHDLQRIAATIGHFNLPGLLCINKADMNPEIKQQIIDWAMDEGIPVAGEIDFDERMMDCVMQGEIITQAYPHSRAAGQVRALWTALAQVLLVEN